MRPDPFTPALGFQPTGCTSTGATPPVTIHVEEMAIRPLFTKADERHIDRTHHRC
jgi:hypothetical protein